MIRRLSIVLLALGCVFSDGVAAAEPELVSRQSPARGGAAADRASGDASISRDGRLVTFTSGARNLSDEAAEVNVFLHDRRTGETALISDPQRPHSYEPAISADGQFVAFVAGPDTLTAEKTVYLRDLRTGSVTVVGRTPTSLGYAYPQAPPAISGTGRLVVFEAGERRRLRLFDRKSRKSRTIATVPRGYFSGLSISLDGRVIAYTELRKTPQGDDQVSTYRYDRRHDRRRLLARYVTGCCHVGEGIYGTALSADGRRIAYISNRADEPRDLYSTLYVWDARTGRKRSLGRGNDPSIDADGRFISFTRSPVEGDPRMLLHDLKRGKTTSMGIGPQPRLSADGRWIAFHLVAPDPNQVAVLARP